MFQAVLNNTFLPNIYNRQKEFKLTKIRCFEAKKQKYFEDF